MFRILNYGWLPTNQSFSLGGFARLRIALGRNVLVAVLLKHHHVQHRLPLFNGIDHPLQLQGLQVGPDPLVLRVAQSAAGQVHRHARQVRGSGIALGGCRKMIMALKRPLLIGGTNQGIHLQR